MTKQEFERILNYGKRDSDKKYITIEEYRLVEKIYTFHPSISETQGKAQVADLYDVFGIRVFKDMEPTADKARQLEDEIHKKKYELNGLLDKYHDLKGGAI